jgi:hypothetical protein
MAWQQPIWETTFQAAKDLSDYQYELVAITTACKVTNITCSAAKKVGILQNNPTCGMEASVMVVGISKVKAAGAFSTAGLLKPVATTTFGGGVAAATSATKGHNIGYAMQASAQGGDIVTMFINGNIAQQ